MRTVPANMQAALRQTHQTQHNNASPSIICDLDYNPGRFDGLASFDLTRVGGATPSTASATVRYAGGAQATVHTQVGGEYVTYSVYTISPEGGTYISEYHHDNPALSRTWMSQIQIIPTHTNGMTMAINGRVQRGPRGPELITEGSPIIFASIGYRINAYAIDTAARRVTYLRTVYTNSIANDGRQYNLRAICPAIQGQSAPGICLYFSKGYYSTGYNIHREIMALQYKDGTATSAVSLMDLKQPDGYYGVMDQYAIAADQDRSGRVILDIYCNLFPQDGGDPAEKVKEIRMASGDPLTVGSTIDVTDQFSAAIYGTQRVLRPMWMLHFSDGTTQRVAMYGSDNTQDLYQSITTDSRYDMATWSSWIKIQGTTYWRYVADMQVLPDGTATMLYSDTIGRINAPLSVYVGTRGTTLHLGDVTTDGTITMQHDNGIAQVNLTVQNNDIGLLTSDDSPLRPGTMIRVYLRMGDSDKVPMIAAKIDEVTIDTTSATYTVSGRNLTGYNLSAASIQTDTTLNGTAKQMATSILAMAGIEDYDVMDSSYSFELELGARTTALQALQEIAAYLTSDSQVCELVELPTGKIVFGYRSWINANYQATGYYDFDPAKQYKRRIIRSADAAYSQVVVTGTDDLDEPLTPAVATVRNYSLWDIPGNKTYYADTPGKMTQAQLQTYADNLAATMANVGITQTFTGPINPGILVGDVARDSSKGSIAIGIITSIRHRFGASGFLTEFTTDSGGVVTDGGDISQTRTLGGYTRRQRITDIMTNIAKGTR